MARSVNNVASKKRRKKILQYARGYRGSRKLYRQAREAVEKGWTYAYRDRRNKKRDIRRLWIIRINAAVHQHGLSYSQFMHGIKELNLTLNRKVLSDLAINDPEAFATLVNSVKAKLEQ